MSEKQTIEKGLLGFLRGTPLRYDDPFEPAIDPTEWEAIRETAGLPLRESYVSAGVLFTLGSAPVPAHSGSASALPPQSGKP